MSGGNEGVDYEDKCVMKSSGGKGVVMTTEGEKLMALMASPHHVW